MPPQITFEDLTEPVPAELQPLNQLKPYGLLPEDDDVRGWFKNGFIVKRNFLPRDLCEAYVLRRACDGEYPTPTPYMAVDELRALCCCRPLADLLEKLVGEPMGLHLNLTGWRSTERNWHQDTVLNPAHVGDFYAGVWIALGDITEDCGPFQCVPGSHKWNAMTQERTFRFLPEKIQRRPEWPKYAERFQVPAVEAELDARQAAPLAFFPARLGDVLVWHPRLMHRGSPPRDPSLERRAVIAHYSALSRRIDMPTRAQHALGGWYFVL